MKLRFIPAVISSRKREGQHTKSTLRVAVTFLAAVASYQSCIATTLTFNAPVPGTITDQGGLGTGFTDRLPGTGSAIPINDPNMSLSANPGRLTLQSTYADINPHFPSPTGFNLPQLEAPGLFISGVGTQDFTVSALFRNVQLPNASDQLMLYVGTSQTNVLRAGMHNGNKYLFIENQGAGDVTPFSSSANLFAPGDDIQLTLSRSGGLWQMAWQDLTTASSGSSPTESLPWLDAQSNLYVGVLAADAGTPTSFTAQIDTFSVTVPEPSSWALLMAGLGLVGLTVRRRVSA